MSTHTPPPGAVGAAVGTTIALLDKAINQFGAYNLHDKGADEVMDVAQVKEILRFNGVEATVETLVALQAHENGEPLTHYLIASFVEDEEWPELTDALIAGPHAKAFVPWLVERC